MKVWKTRCFFAASGENILPTGLRPIGRAAAGGCGAGGAKTRKGGEKVMELLKQPQYSPMDVYDQIIVLFSAKHRFIKKVPLNQIKIYQNELLNWMHKQYAHLIKDLQKLNYFDEKLEESFKQAIQQFTDQFIDE